MKKNSSNSVGVSDFVLTFAPCQIANSPKFYVVKACEGLTAASPKEPSSFRACFLWYFYFMWGSITNNRKFYSSSFIVDTRIVILETIFFLIYT